MKGRSRPGQGGSAKTTEALDVNTSVVSADDRSARVRARRVVMIDAACELALAGGSSPAGQPGHGRKARSPSMVTSTPPWNPN
jgi:hypothetical protein